VTENRILKFCKVLCLNLAFDRYALIGTIMHGILVISILVTWSGPSNVFLCGNLKDYLYSGRPQQPSGVERYHSERSQLKCNCKSHFTCNKMIDNSSSNAEYMLWRNIRHKVLECFHCDNDHLNNVIVNLVDIRPRDHCKLTSQLKQMMTLRECTRSGKRIDPRPRKREISDAKLRDIKT